MDIRKTMEFLLEQQAAHAVRLAALDARLDRLTAATEQNNSQIQSLAMFVESHESDLRAHDEWLAGISRELQTVTGLMRQSLEAEVRRERRLDRMDEAVARLAESVQRLIDGNLPPGPVQ